MQAPVMALKTYKESGNKKKSKIPNNSSHNNLIKEPLSYKASARDLKQLENDIPEGSDEYVFYRDSMVFQTLPNREHENKSVTDNNNCDGESDINPPGRQALSQISSSRENPTQKVMI